MPRIRKIKNQRGFTLIEALFSAIVLGIGLLALAGFHAVALQDGAAVKMRMAATNLAQEKLEDLKSFSRLEDNAATTAVDECASGIFCYSEIAGGAGGAENGDGSLKLAASTFTLSGTTFTRAWTVVCYSDAANAAPAVDADCSDPDSKQVTVTLNWTDSKGMSQSVSLQAMIYGLDPSNMASAATNYISSNAPKVASSAPADEPGTDVESGTQKSSKPLPTVSSKGYSLSTSFDTVIYNSSGFLVSKQENKTVNCVCEFASTAGPAYPASYFYWKDSSLAVKVPDATVTKTTALAPTIQGDTQDVLCDVCCRDHHDSEAPGTSNPTTALYDPDRPTSDYESSGDHKHYYYTDTGCAGNPNLAGCDKTQGIEAVTSGLYLESCRMTRVDGIWRVMQDWAAQDVVVVPEGYLDTGTATRTLYETYKSKLLRYAAYSKCVAAGGTGCSSISQTSPPAKSSMTNRDLSDQSTLSYEQLRAYAVYVDRIWGESAPRTLDDSYYTNLAAEIAAYQSDSTDLTWLDMMSFNEVNVTLFASWNSSDPAVVTVANETIKNIDSGTSDYYGVYRRGLTQVQSGSGSHADITAYLLPSSSGLNGGVTRETFTGMPDYDASTLAASGTVPYSSEIGIDRHDHASSLRKSDTVRIGRAGSSTGTYTVQGQIRSGNSSAETTLTVTASGTPAVTCTVSPFGSTGSFTGTFSCNVSSGYSGTITVSSSATGAFYDYSVNKSDTVYDTEKVDGYSSSFAVNTSNCTQVGDVWDCGMFWVFGPKINITGLCDAGGYTTSLCGHNKVVVSADGTDPGTADNAACDTGSAPTCTSLMLNSSHTWTGTIGVTVGTGGTGGSGKPSHWDADTSCSNGATTANTTRTTSSITVGPTDATEAFTMCVSDE